MHGIYKNLFDSPPSYLAITTPPLFEERGLGGELFLLIAILVLLHYLNKNFSH